jgi:hypothetical protein
MISGVINMSKKYVDAIKARGISIYDPIEIGDPDLWVPTPDLERILDEEMRGISLAGLALRTRSKVAKEHVCQALGYPVPKSFKKTQPRFPGQCFDTYVQAENNLQVWNEALSSIRRYVLIRPDKTGSIVRVKVVTGEDLAPLDRTGTLTQKYQARAIVGTAATELVTAADTSNLAPHVGAGVRPQKSASPIDYPVDQQLLPIAEVFERLSPAVGQSFPDAGRDQERNRGAALHRLVCEFLGYSDYRDDGRFPDVRHQLLEVKLQTSPTIDLGLVRPDSCGLLDLPQIAGTQVRHCDVRYAVFYAVIEGGDVRLTHLFLTTGEGFFGRFPQFQGKVLNNKIQMHLPDSFFTS